MGLRQSKPALPTTHVFETALNELEDRIAGLEAQHAELRRSERDVCQGLSLTIYIVATVVGGIIYVSFATAVYNVPIHAATSSSLDCTLFPAYEWDKKAELKGDIHEEIDLELPPGANLFALNSKNGVAPNFISKPDSSAAPAKNSDEENTASGASVKSGEVVMANSKLKSDDRLHDRKLNALENMDFGAGADSFSEADKSLIVESANENSDSRISFESGDLATARNSRTKQISVASSNGAPYPNVKACSATTIHGAARRFFFFLIYGWPRGIVVAGFSLLPLLFAVFLDIAAKRLVHRYFRWRLTTCDRQVEEARHEARLKANELRKITEFERAREIIARLENVSQPGFSSRLLESLARKNPNLQFDASTGDIVNAAPPLSARASLGRLMSRIFDRIVVPDSERVASMYALICKACGLHNGLVPPEEFSTTVYLCRSCGLRNYAASGGSEAALTPKTGAYTRLKQHSFSSSMPLTQMQLSSQPTHLTQMPVASPLSPWSNGIGMGSVQNSFALREEPSGIEFVNSTLFSKSGASIADALPPDFTNSSCFEKPDAESYLPSHPLKSLTSIGVKTEKQSSSQNVVAYDLNHRQDAYESVSKAYNSGVDDAGNFYYNDAAGVKKRGGPPPPALSLLQPLSPISATSNEMSPLKTPTAEHPPTPKAISVIKFETTEKNNGDLSALTEKRESKTSNIEKHEHDD